MAKQMRNYLKNLNIVGAICIYHEGDMCKYSIDNLLEHCDKICISMDYPDEKTLAIIEKGHEIKGIYLFGSGVYNLVKDADTGNILKNLPDQLQEFCSSNNIQIGGCSTWISFTGLKSEDFIGAACQMGLGELSEWVEESDNVIVFGAGG